jgi:hypothetical protein
MPLPTLHLRVVDTSSADPVGRAFRIAVFRIAVFRIAVFRIAVLLTSELTASV